MKKIALLSITLVLILTMIGCPSTVNIGPKFVRIETVDGKDTVHKLIPLSAEDFKSSRTAFYNSESYDGVSEFDYHDYYNEDYIIYEFVRGEFNPAEPNFDPEKMLEDLIENYHIEAIDYKQDYVEWFADRDYNRITDQIAMTSFYDIWLGDEDANHDGVVNEEDIPFYDDYKTDEDGNYVYDESKILLIDFILPVGDVVDFTLRVVDEDGDVATIDGVILIVAEEE